MGGRRHPGKQSLLSIREPQHTTNLYVQHVYDESFVFCGAECCLVYCTY